MNQYDKALEYAINNYQLGMYMRGEGPYRDEDRYTDGHVNPYAILHSLYRVYPNRPQIKEMAAKEIFKMASESAENCHTALGYLNANAFDIMEEESVFKFEIETIYDGIKNWVNKWEYELADDSIIKKAIRETEEDLKNMGYIK